MLICILLPLLVSWIFKRLKIKRIYLTYLISGTIMLLLALIDFMLKHLINGALSPKELIDKKAITAIIGTAGVTLFLTVFFQYIFNKTMQLKQDESQKSR